MEKHMLEMIQEHPALYEADYKAMEKKVSESKAIYKGEPVPFLYVPKLYDSKDMLRFEEATKGIVAIVNRTIEAYFSSAEVRSLFQFDKRLERLILESRSSASHVPMGRYDIFDYGDSGYMFCELNADGASAMNEQKELAEVLKKSTLSQKISESHHLEIPELFHSWVKTVGELYNTYRADQLGKAATHRPEKIHVAIVDFMDKGSSVEFEVFQKAFESAGYRCSIVDPKNIEVKDGYMCADGVKIDIVYRRLVTKDLLDRYDEIPGFIEGLFLGKTCVLGSIRTQIIHSKRFFQVLHDDKFQGFLTEEERAYVKAHIPFTAPLKAEKMREEFIHSKDDYIIKPVDFYASQGVYAGLDFSENQWLEKLNQCAEQDYIIQRYCPKAEIRNVTFEDQKGFEEKSFQTVTGLFVYNEKLQGVYLRAGLKAIVSGLHQGYTVPIYTLRKKGYRYAVLRSPHANRRYYEATEKLLANEIQILLKSMGENVLSQGYESVGGLGLYTFELESPLSKSLEKALQHLATGYVLFRQYDDHRLEPLHEGKSTYLNEDLPSILKYTGKTNEEFTALLIQVALFSSDFAHEFDRPLTILDPMCGRGTTLFQGLVRGFHALGIDQDKNSIIELNKYFKRYLEYNGIKHEDHYQTIHIDGKRTGLKYNFSVAQDKKAFKKKDTRNLQCAYGDTREINGYFKKDSCHLLVTDLPYGVQHASSGEKAGEHLLKILSKAALEWKKILKKGGVGVVAFNTYHMKKEDLVQIFSQSGFKVMLESPYDQFEHWVEQAVNRDIVVFKK